MICDVCEHAFDHVQSITVNTFPTICPQCGTEGLRQEFGIGLYAHVNKSDDQVTLGTLAERNSKRLSQEEKDRILNKDRIPNSPLPKGMKKIDKTNEKPWYDKYATMKTAEVAKLTPTQTDNYIMTGKK